MATTTESTARLYLAVRTALCTCGCAKQWHWPTKQAYCLSPDCPCRKFEPAGGDA